MFEELPSVNISGANLYIIAKKDIVSPLCHNIVLQFFTRGSVMGVVVSKSLLLLIISSIENFFRSGVRVISLGVIWCLPLMSGTSFSLY